MNQIKTNQIFLFKINLLYDSLFSQIENKLKSWVQIKYLKLNKVKFDKSYNPWMQVQWNYEKKIEFFIELLIDRDSDGSLYILLELLVMS